MFLVILSAVNAESKLIIAVIDTGLEINQYTKDIPLCFGKHADFTTDRLFMDQPPEDSLKHGTNVTAALNNQIIKISNSKDYCIAILKYINSKKEFGAVVKSIEAKKYAQKIGAKIVNFSSVGDIESTNETIIVKKLLDSGIKIFVSAGNEGKLIDKPSYLCEHSPAAFAQTRKCKRIGIFPGMSDNRVVVVGNLSKNGGKHATSNYGPRVDRWEVGEEVEAGGYKSTGTSQAAAIATGKYVGELLNEKRK